MVTAILESLPAEFPDRVSSGFVDPGFGGIWKVSNIDLAVDENARSPA